MAEHFVIHKSLSTLHQGSNINLMEKNDNFGLLWVSATERSMIGAGQWAGGEAGHGPTCRNVGISK